MGRHLEYVSLFGAFFLHHTEPNITMYPIIPMDGDLIDSASDPEALEKLNEFGLTVRPEESEPGWYPIVSMEGDTLWL